MWWIWLAVQSASILSRAMGLVLSGIWYHMEISHLLGFQGNQKEEPERFIFVITSVYAWTPLLSNTDQPTETQREVCAHTCSFTHCRSAAVPLLCNEWMVWAQGCNLTPLQGAIIPAPYATHHCITHNTPPYLLTQTPASVILIHKITFLSENGLCIEMYYNWQI